MSAPMPRPYPRNASAQRSRSVAAAPLPPWTAMKEGLLGGTLVVSPRSESKEARLHVARWIGFESTQGRRLPGLDAGGDRRRVGVAAGCRRPARPGREGGDVGAGGSWGDRVDERRAVRARPPRGARLGGADRRRHQGQGPGAVGVQDRQDRRQVLATLSARDLVPEIWLPDPSDPPRARAGPLSAAPRPSSHDAEEPHPRRVDRLRPSVPGVGSVRSRRPRAARPPGDPGPVAGQHRRQPGADR